MRKVMLALALTACAGADGTDGTDGRDGRDGSDGETPEVSVRDASDDDCPAGGTELQVGEETVVLCDGEPGESGEPGPAGEPGMDAEAGENIGRIELTIACRGELTGTTSMVVLQQIVVFTDGSVFASAQISNGVTNASASALYAPSQAGSLDGGLVIPYDVVAPTAGGFWTVSFDVATRESVVVYDDVDVTDGSDAWTMPASDCIVNEY